MTHIAEVDIVVSLIEKLSPASSRSVFNSDCCSAEWISISRSDLRKEIASEINTHREAIDAVIHVVSNICDESVDVNFSIENDNCDQVHLVILKTCLSLDALGAGKIHFYSRFARSTSGYMLCEVVHPETVRDFVLSVISAKLKS